jgi:hypothetical protein
VNLSPDAIARKIIASRYGDIDAETAIRLSKSMTLADLRAAANGADSAALEAHQSAEECDDYANRRNEYARADAHSNRALVLWAAVEVYPDLH